MAHGHLDVQLRMRERAHCCAMPSGILVLVSSLHSIDPVYVCSSLSVRPEGRETADTA
jgi:hypothetical protein